MITNHRPAPSVELERIEGAPLPPARLAQLWAQLPERERLPFLHSLDEGLADAVLAACIKYSAGPAGKGDNH